MNIQHNAHGPDYAGILASQSGLHKHENEVSAAAYLKDEYAHDTQLREEDSIISYSMASNSRPPPITRQPHVVQVTKPLHAKPSKMKSPRKGNAFYGPFDRPPSWRPKRDDTVRGKSNLNFLYTVGILYNVERCIRKSDLLLSYSTITVALHITIILIITHQSLTFQSLKTRRTKSRSRRTSSTASTDCT